MSSGSNWGQTEEKITRTSNHEYSDHYSYDLDWTWRYATNTGYNRVNPTLENNTNGNKTSTTTYYKRYDFSHSTPGIIPNSHTLSNDPPETDSDSYNEVIEYVGFNNYFNVSYPGISKVYRNDFSYYYGPMYYPYYYDETSPPSVTLVGVFACQGNSGVIFGSNVPSAARLSIGPFYFPNPTVPNMEQTVPSFDGFVLNSQSDSALASLKPQAEEVSFGTQILVGIGNLSMQAEEAFYASVEWTVSTASWLANGAVSIAVSVWDSTVGAAYNNWNKVYNDMQATGSGFWMSVYAATGTVVADAVGIVGLSNAYEGEDLYTGRQLSGAERVFEGVMGATQLITTACGGVGAIRSGIRSSGNCGTKLGKMFTNCCFTAETQIVVGKTETVKNNAIQQDKASVYYRKEDGTYGKYLVTLAFCVSSVILKTVEKNRRKQKEEEYRTMKQIYTENDAEPVDLDAETLSRIADRQRAIQSAWETTPEACLDAVSEKEPIEVSGPESKSRICRRATASVHTKGSWLGYAGTFFFVLAILSLLWNVLPSDNNVEAVSQVATSQPPVVETKYVTKNIEDIRIGDRTLGTNPQGIEASEADSEIFQKVKHNGYTLLYLKENQTLSVIELLRPENWLDAENIQIRRASDDKVLTEEELNILEAAKAFEKDDEDYDLEVWIELPEMGVVGWATLVAIDGEVKIQDGPGNVVTGTFAHISDNVIDLQIEDQDKPIGCTANHPFWSVDRQDFIEAGQLLEGEQVQLYSGETKRVVQKLPRPGPQVVYNLEVYAEHMYHVTQDGVLVHNACNSKILGDNMVAAGIKRRAKTAAHHIVATTSKKAHAARDVLKRAGIDINDANNGIFLSFKKHHHIHTKRYYEKINKVLIQAEKNKENIQKTLAEIAAKIRKGSF